VVELSGSSSVETVEKLPTPEEVFKVPKLTWSKKTLILWGGGVIALGVSIGSGEFILGPSVAIKHGLGLLWLVLVGTFLQTIYVYSWVRFVIALGETPIAMMFRLAAIAGILGSFFVFLTFIWGGWAASSAAALVGGILHTVPGPEHRLYIVVAGWAIILFSLFILSLGKRVARTMEILFWFDLAVIFTSFIVLAIILVPPSIWAEAAVNMVRFGYVPPGIDPLLLAAWWGYTAYASGINYILANYFKDKGFGMGSITGYIPAVIGGKVVPYSPTGKLFKITEENIQTYRRWSWLAFEELMVLFFIGAVIGMVVPMLLAYGILYGWGVEVRWGAPIWFAMALEKFYGAPGWWWGVIVALLVLVKTQIGVADAIVRAFIDSLWRLESVKRICRNDIRILYYALIFVIFAWASLAFIFAAPVTLIMIAAASSNLGVLIGVPALLYVNYKIMPPELRLHPILIVLNIIFFIACLIFGGLYIGRLLGII
jgi:hypothetical protein